MSNPLLAPYPYPGKFEGEINLTERLYDLSLDGWADAELGDVDTFGYYELFDGLPAADFGDLDGICAAILYTNSQGFVSGTYYTSGEDARAAWAELEREYEEETSREEEEEEEGL